MRQINVMSGFLEAPMSSEKLDLPDNQHERVKILMTPDPTARSLRDKRINSPTCLLAVTLAFKIINRFSGGTTQRKMQEVYSVCARQLAACVTGKNYWGSTDRKCKTSGDKDGSSSSKRPTTE